MSSVSQSGVLGFTCDETATGTKLNYKLGGTDTASFKLSNTAISVTLKEKDTKVENAPLTIAKLAAPGSTVNKTKVTGLCPELGEGWLFLHPKVYNDYGRLTANTAKAYVSTDEVKVAVMSIDAAAVERNAENPSTKDAEHA